jgi:hypothetical protein
MGRIGGGVPETTDTPMTSPFGRDAMPPSPVSPFGAGQAGQAGGPPVNVLQLDPRTTPAGDVRDGRDGHDRRGGTLASSTPQNIVDPPPRVGFVAPSNVPFGETLPSSERRPAGSRDRKSSKGRRGAGDVGAGVPVTLVVTLVAVSLAIGFFLGLAVGRM